MSDDDLPVAFDAGLLPADMLDDRMHVRLAWLCLRRRGPEAGARRMAAGLRAFTTAAGVPGKFDDGLTTAWCARISKAIASDPGVADFDRFAGRNPGLVERSGQRRASGVGDAAG